MMAGGTFVQPVHPSMVPGSSYNVPGLAVSFPGQAMPSVHTTSSDHQQHHQKAQYSGLNDPNLSSNQTSIGGPLSSQNMTPYEADSNFTQFRSDTNRGNQAASRDKQNYHDENSGFGSHYGQYRSRNNRGVGNRGQPGQGNSRGGSKSYHPTNGYNSRNMNTGRPGQAGKPRPSNKQSTQDPRNAGSSMVWSS